MKKAAVLCYSPSLSQNAFAFEVMSRNADGAAQDAMSKPTERHITRWYMVTCRLNALTR